MSQYQEYAEKPTEFLALTGYTRQEFDALLPHFRDSYYQRMKTHRLDGKPRGKRKYSDYQNCPLLLMEDKLFFILNYLKTNNLQTVQGAFFGISQPKANVWIHCLHPDIGLGLAYPKANVWIHCLHPILNQSLAALGELPARKMEDVSFDETEATLYFHDGTERPIQRPSDPDQQQLYYSGKKSNTGSKIIC